MLSRGDGRLISATLIGTRQARLSVQVVGHDRHRRCRRLRALKQFSATVSGGVKYVGGLAFWAEWRHQRTGLCAPPP